MEGCGNEYLPVERFDSCPDYNFFGIFMVMMKKKFTVLLAFIVFTMSFISGIALNGYVDNKPNVTTIDTIPPVPVDTVHHVKGKSALFIGDSHTANHNWGWQVLLCKETGLIMNNTAVIGKHTPWMVSIAKSSIHPGLEYCFIYGGANDIHGNRNPYEVVGNIQKIVDICNSKGVKAVVLTGFDAEKCVKPINGQEFYPKAYSRYQRILMENIKGASVIDTRVVVRTDCGDWTCHMNPSGHRKVANAVIKQMKFKNY